MRKRTRPQTRTNKTSQDNPRLSWKYSALTVVCGATLVTGFFFAARQHFSSMDYGIKNSRLRKQLDELEAEKRRLLLNREISLSPSELMKAARKFAGGQFTSDPTDSIKPEQISATAKPKAINPPVVEKTVISKPVQSTKAPESKPAKIERQAKKETAPRDKKYKS